MTFSPKFAITPKLATCLMRIGAAKQAVQDLPITPSVLATLRETARLFSTHYSTRIEGNRLSQEQVAKVIEDQQHFPGRERDEKEVLGYYAALEKLEQFTASTSSIAETHIQTLHALVMADRLGRCSLSGSRRPSQEKSKVWVGNGIQRDIRLIIFNAGAATFTKRFVGKNDRRTDRTEFSDVSCK